MPKTDPIDLTSNMWIREYAAIHILAGLSINAATDVQGVRVAAAETAVLWADALIAALNKPQEASK